MIPDEAIEAAAEALVGSTLGDRAGIKWEEFFEAARSALNASAPYLMAEAWDEGSEARRAYAYSDDMEPLTNPYRKDAR